MKEIIEELTKKYQTISTMESCTGGGVANAITNIEGASEVFQFGAVTYSNDYKIKMGVSPKTLEKYTVYSEETAKEMSKTIATYTNSDYGIGITGKLNRVDKNNPFGKDNIVFISIYEKGKDKYYTKIVKADQPSRKENKEKVIQTIIKLLKEIVVTGGSYERI